MNPPNWVQNRALKILPQNKRVLAVEDDLDSAVYTVWLRKLAAAQGTIISNKLVVVSAGEIRDHSWPRMVPRSRWEPQGCVWSR